MQISEKCNNYKVRFIFITGGVVSSLGKGIACASFGLILTSMGFKVKFVKCDPYLNIDPGTMNPNQHGEVFVTSDGCETDLDLGHYERFTGVKTTKNSSITSGKIYSTLLEKERKGIFLGQTVQTIPHVTNEIKSAIYANIEDDIDFILCEIGGTVGDIEASPFLEAIRQIAYEYGQENVLYAHMTLVPYLKAAGELKTKPTQHSVRELRSIGIQPSILLCRSEYPLSEENRMKIAGFCNMKYAAVIPALDNENIYEIPLKFCEYNLDKVLCDYFKIHQPNPTYLNNWQNLIKSMKSTENVIKIALIAKYVEVNDSYKSIFEALKHAGIQNQCKVTYQIIDAHNLNEKNTQEILQNFDAMIVLGGFGTSGIEGKIEAVKYARINKMPFFGICLGMQLVVIEAARNLLGLSRANSTEFDDKTPDPVVIRINEWLGNNNIKEIRNEHDNLGGTMRMGSYKCKIKHDSLAYQIYQEEFISERHRHRYEINNDYINKLEQVGLKFSGSSAQENLMEIVEIPDHPFFIAVQFHPEFQSSVLNGHPIFNHLVKFVKENHNNNC